MQTLSKIFAFRMTEDEWDALQADYEQKKQQTGIDFDFADYIRGILKQSLQAGRKQ